MPVYALTTWDYRYFIDIFILYDILCTVQEISLTSIFRYDKSDVWVTIRKYNFNNNSGKFN